MAAIQQNKDVLNFEFYYPPTNSSIMLYNLVNNNLIFFLFNFVFYTNEILNLTVYFLHENS